MTKPTCANCDRPSPDGAPLCSRCAHTLEVALTNISAYSRDLDLIRARQTAYTDRNGGSRSAETPLPVDLRVAGIEWDVRNTLASWVRLVVEHRGDHHGTPAPTIPAMCLWLTTRAVEWLRHRSEGPDALDEILDAEKRLQRLVDRPVERWYAGACNATDETTESGTCETDLYAKVGGRQVECPKCQATYDVQERREWLLDAAEDQLAGATLIARALVTLADAKVTPERVWKWAERGRIVAKAHDERGRPMYRVGDVLDLVLKQAEKPDKKRSA